MNKPFPVTLSLGSNLGNREQNLKRAIDLLSKDIIHHPKVSSFHQTKPLDCPPNTPDFLNAAISGQTFLCPFELLLSCQKIERFLGRPENHDFHANRTIDIDILTYGNLTLNSNTLTLPHPEMHRREFVLGPLSEIMPDLNSNVSQSLFQKS